MVNPSPGESTRARKVAIDAVLILCLLLFCAFKTRPWITDPVHLLIGYAFPEYGLVSTDVMLSLSLSGWFPFALGDLSILPFQHTEYLMYPHGSSHGYSFDGLMLALVVAVLQIVLSLEFAFALAVFLAPMLMGFFTWRLIHRRIGRSAIAFASALIAAATPFLFQRMAHHPNLAYIWALPVCVHAFFNLLDKPTWKRAVWFGASVALCAACSWYVLLMSLIFCVPAAAYFLTVPRRPPLLRRVGLGLAAMATTTVVVLTFAFMMLFNSGTRAPIEVEMMTRYSAPLVQYLLPNPDSVIGELSRFGRLQAIAGTQWEGLVGGPILCYALLLGALIPRRTRRVTWLLAAAAGLGVIVTLGPRLGLTAAPDGDDPRMPYYFFCIAFEKFNILRSPGRMCPIVNLCAIAGSAFLLAEVYRRWGRRNVAWRVGFYLFLGFYTAVNLAWSVDLDPYPTSALPKVSPFYHELAEEGGDGAILDVPISGYYFPHYNYYQLTHGRPVVSSVLFHDAVHGKAIEYIWRERPFLLFLLENNQAIFSANSVEGFWRTDPLATLADDGVEYVIFHKLMLQFTIEQGIASPRTSAFLKEIQARWEPYEIYEDDLIVVYRTTKDTIMRKAE